MLIFTKVPTKARKKAKKVVKTVKAKRAFVPKSKPVETKYQAPGTKHIKSHIDAFLASDPKLAVPQQYEGDMAAREAAAQAEIARKSKCVAPAFNKGPYTYIASEEQAKWVGRK